MDSDAIAWSGLTEADLPEIAALAGRVLAADGGLPLITDRSFLAPRYAAAASRARGARHGDRAPGGRLARDDGALLAAGAVRPGPAGPIVTGMVDPATRGRGLGAALLDWALSVAVDVDAASVAPEAGAPARQVFVETESLTPQAEALLGARGLRRVLAEDVMRFDLAGAPPDVRLPEGVALEIWSDATAQRFFDVYTAAFAERPNFPNWSSDRWRDWLTGDDEDFRAHWSLLVVDGQRGDVAFIACAAGWIVQVGVRPDQRGRRLGAGLVAEALRRMRAAGESEALLDVSVDNPAAALYRRLGFGVVGRRARFARRLVTL